MTHEELKRCLDKAANELNNTAARDGFITENDIIKVLNEHLGMSFAIIGNYKYGLNTMPSSCNKCHFCEYDDGCSITGDYSSMNDCPLVELKEDQNVDENR